jgi:glycerophosphoryl diester phosphodiesterase
MHSPRLLAVTLIALMSLAAAPIVIAHRGASGYRPEHTLAAYELGIEQGADFIEPDLVLTKDGRLIARHEPMLAQVDPSTGAILEATTDVPSRPEYAGRKSTRNLDGKTLTGWWADDFTLAEIKTLGAVERLPRLRPASAAHDGKHEIPTLDEIIALAHRHSARLGRPIGIYPETKHPTYSAEVATRLGIAPMEDTLVRLLHQHYPNSPDAPVFIQSFESENLRRLRTLTRIRLVQLISANELPYDLRRDGDARSVADFLADPGLRDIATYANAIGAHKSLVIPVTQGKLDTPTDLVPRAHAAGLLVHVWTLRAENNFLPASLRQGTDPASLGNAQSEARAFFAAGVDGIFTDHPDTTLPARTPRITRPAP